MRTHRTLALFGTAAALLFFVTGPAMAQKANLPEAVKKLIPAAQKEGTATIFGTTLNPRKVATINKSFNAFYGTDIKLIQTGGRHTRKRVEVARALKNNVPTGLDLFWTSSPRALVDSGSLTKFDWTKEFGLPASLKSGEYGIKTHDSYLTMVTINTNLVKPGDEPKTYDDLLDRSGTPLGADFSMFYVAGQMTAAGETAQLYDQAAHQARLHDLFPGIDPQFALPYRYPPIVALLMVPLAVNSPASLPNNSAALS